MNILSNIANNDELREALKAYMLEYMVRRAGTDALSGKDVSGYKEAQTVLIKGLNQITEDFGEKKPKKYVNHAV